MKFGKILMTFAFLLGVAFAQEKAEGIYLTQESFEKGIVDIEGTFVRRIGSKVVFMVAGEETRFKPKEVFGYVMRKVDLETSEEVLAAFTNFNEGSTYYEIVERGPIWLFRNKKVYTDETGTIVDDRFYISNGIGDERVDFKNEKKGAPFFQDDEKLSREYHSYFKFKKRKLDINRFVNKYNAMLMRKDSI